MRGCPKTIRNRRAFSLAEVMIAIGILGVGLLMVAATFPVGLDQSRIVAEQTIAPLVVEDAFQRLKLLLDEPATAKRVMADVTDPSKGWALSFRESIRQVANEQVLLGVAVGPIRAYLSNGDATADPALDSVKPPYTWTGLNELLVAPFILSSTKCTTPVNPPGDYYPVGTVAPPGVLFAGVGTRFYPSVGAMVSSNVAPGAMGPYPSCHWMVPLRSTANGDKVMVDPPYTWSALYRVYSIIDSVSPPIRRDYVQFFVFVNRRGENWPKDWPNGFSFISGTNRIAKYVQGEIWILPNAWSVKQELAEGNILVLNDPPPPVGTGTSTFTICRVKQIEMAKEANTDIDSTNPQQFHRVVLDQTPNTVPSGFWYVPVDAGSGRSPCIEVQSRTYRLQ